MNDVNAPDPFNCNIASVNLKIQNYHVLNMLSITAFQQKSVISSKYAVTIKYKSKFLNC